MKSPNNLLLLLLVTIGLFAIAMAITVPTVTTAVDPPKCSFDGTVRETCVNGKLQTSFMIEFKGPKYTMIIEPGKQYFQGLNFLWYPPVPADTRGNMYFGAPTCQFWENNNRPTPLALCGSCTRTRWSGKPLNCANAEEDGSSRVRVDSCGIYGSLVKFGAKSNCIQGHDMHCNYTCA